MAQTIRDSSPLALAVEYVPRTTADAREPPVSPTGGSHPQPAQGFGQNRKNSKWAYRVRFRGIATKGAIVQGVLRLAPQARPLADRAWIHRFSLVAN
jgi:hypothetical protein